MSEYRAGYANTLWCLWPEDTEAVPTDDMSPWEHLPGVLSSEACDGLVLEAEAEGMVRRQEYGAGETTSSHWMADLADTEKWHDLYVDAWGLLEAFAIKYGIGVSGMVEPARVMGYEPGDHIGWHADAHRYDMSKVTLVVQLTDPLTYHGGDLHLLNQTIPRLRKGDALLFPSYVAHRVQTVHGGTRYVLTAWAAGPRFT